MSSETLTTISPSTNQPIVIRRAASPEEIANLPSIAQNAFAAYRKSCPTLSSRQKIVTKALQLLNEKQDELAKELTQQMGRPIAYTAKEITTAVKRGEYKQYCRRGSWPGRARNRGGRLAPLYQMRASRGGIGALCVECNYVLDTTDTLHPFNLFTRLIFIFLVPISHPR